MLNADVRFISVDDHLVEPPNLWQDRLPARLKEAGPRVVEEPSGAQLWLYEEKAFPQMFNRSWAPAVTDMEAGTFDPLEDIMASGQVSGVLAEHHHPDSVKSPLRYEQIRPGCYDPKARLDDMDRDGVYAQINFPSFPRFAGTRFKGSKDIELATLCVRAWNDFILEEWCPTAPDRYIPMVIVPFWDVDASVAELERTVAAGAKAVSFPENPAPLGLPSFHQVEHWAPFLAAVDAADITMCLHFGSSGQTPSTAADAPFIVTSALMGVNAMATLADLTFSPVLRRFPNLRFVLSESGIGWIPYMVERLDQVWREHRNFYDVDRTTPPSEVFVRQFWSCSVQEPFGLSVSEQVGWDRILLESDYPHSDSSWPNSRTRAEALLRNVPDDAARRIAELNAYDAFKLTRV